MNQSMLEAFIEYEQRDPATCGPLRNLIGMPVGSRLLRMYRRQGHWQLWLATRDYVFGTYLLVYDNGMIERITEFVDEGPEQFTVRPTDEEIRNSTCQTTGQE